MLFRSDLPATRDLVQNVTRQWRETLGVDIQLESVEGKVYRSRVNDQEYALAPGNWIGDYADPSTFTDKYLANSANNDSKWVNQEYEKLCAAATKETDADKRLRLLEGAERILNDDCPVLPLYYLVNVYMFRDNVKGLFLHPRNTSILKNYWVDRESHK